MKKTFALIAYCVFITWNVKAHIDITKELIQKGKWHLLPILALPFILWIATLHFSYLLIVTVPKIKMNMYLAMGIFGYAWFYLLFGGPVIQQIIQEKYLGYPKRSAQ